jgi:acetylornithine deacetylase/succinyl-diaminopimelate desuccinylase-like protein
MYGPSQPSMIYGLKGLLYTEIRVHGPNRDLHSGAFGGAVTNPMNALAEVVSKPRDPGTGRVLVPGFYDDVVPLAEWERAEFAKLPFDAEAYRAELGVPELFGEDGYTTLERAWARPTCDVNGMWGGYQGPGAKTIIPARGGAKVSMRLVPDQDPERIARAFESYVSAVAPPGVEASVEIVHFAPPVLIDIDKPVAHAALAAMEEVWGTAPVKVREGGSIPIVSTFAEELGAPVLLIGFGLADDRLHSPNEKFNISHFYGGIRSIARLLDRAAELE